MIRFLKFDNLEGLKKIYNFQKIIKISNILIIQVIWKNNNKK